RDRGNIAEFLQLTSDVWRVRAFDDFWSYMLVAEGAVDIACEPELELYDMAALVPIVTEAGGMFTSLDGEPGPWGGHGLATNGLMHDDEVERLNPELRGQTRAYIAYRNAAGCRSCRCIRCPRQSVSALAHRDRRSTATYRPVAHHAGESHRCGTTRPFYRLCRTASLARSCHQRHNHRVLWSVYHDVRLSSRHHRSRLRASCIGHGQANRHIHDGGHYRRASSVSLYHHNAHHWHHQARDQVGKW